MNKLIYNSKEDLANAFIDFLENKVKNKEGTFYLALSGGSTPLAIFEQLSKCADNDWLHRIEFYWGDERFVPYSNGESNYGNALAFLIKPCGINEKQVHPIPILKTPALAALAYEETLLQNLPKANHLPRFDLVMLGMGDDGHTVSIFPDEIGLWSSKKLCEVAHHPLSKQVRITLTGGIINNAMDVCFLVTGVNKAKKIELIAQGGVDATIYPAFHVNPSSGNLLWFLDNEAAKLI